MNNYGKNSKSLTESLTTAEDELDLAKERFDYPEGQNRAKGVSPNPFFGSPTKSSAPSLANLDASQKAYETNKKRLARFNADIRFLTNELAEQKANKDPSYRATEGRLKEISTKRNKLAQEQEVLARLLSYPSPEGGKASAGGQTGMLNSGQPGNEEKIRELTEEAIRLRGDVARKREQKAQRDATWAFLCCCCQCLNGMGNMNRVYNVSL